MLQLNTSTSGHYEAFSAAKLYSVQSCLGLNLDCNALHNVISFSSLSYTVAISPMDFITAKMYLIFMFTLSHIGTLVI